MKLNRPRNWIVLILVVIVATVLLGGEAIMSRIIRSRLQAMVESSLNAELQMGNVRYHFPYGVTIDDAAFLAPGPSTGSGKVQIFGVKKLQLSLAKLPLGSGPLVIERLILSNPALHLINTDGGIIGQQGLVKEEVAQQAKTQQQGPPRKLSEMFHLRRFKIDAGQITYEDCTHPLAQPVVWNDLQLDLKTTPQTGGVLYDYTLMAQNVPLADASVEGTMNIDELLLEVKRFALQLHVSSDTPQRQLPSIVQKLLLANEVNGKLFLNGTARIPLRKINQSRFAGTLDLPQASAKSSQWDARLDRLALKVHFSDMPMGAGLPSLPASVPATNPSPYLEDLLTGTDETLRADEVSPSALSASLPADAPPPLYIRIEKFLAATGDSQIQLSGGSASIDPVAGTWRVRRLYGSLVVGANHQTLPSDLQSLFDRVKLQGKMEFTAAASGPIAPAPAAGQRGIDLIEYHLRAYPRDLSLQPPEFAGPLEKLSGAIDITPPLIAVHNFEANYGGDHIFLIDARLPLKDIQNDIRINDINGSVTFHAPSPAYPHKLGKLIAQLRPSGTFFISGYCSILPDVLADYIPPDENAPLSSPDAMPVTGHVHVASPSAVAPASRLPTSASWDKNNRDDFEYHFDVSTDDAAIALGPRAVPLTKVQSDVSIATNYVQIASLRAAAFDGRLEAKGQARTGRVLAYNGRATVTGINVKQLSEFWFGSSQAAMHLSGNGYISLLVSGTGARFERSVADNFTAKGELEILEGNFWELPVIKEVIDRVKVAREALTVGTVAGTFDIRSQTFYFKNAAVSAPILGLNGSGSVRFDGQVDGDVIAAPLSDWRQQMQQLKIPIVGQAASTLAGGVQKLINAATRKLLYQFHITGTLAKPNISIIPAPVITENVAAIFGKMLNLTGTDHLLDVLKKEPEPK